MSVRVSLFGVFFQASLLCAEPSVGVTTLVHEGQVNSIAFSPDGKTLAAVGERRDKSGEIVLWDVGTSKTANRLFGHGAAVQKVVFSPNGKTLATMNQEYLM